MQALVKPLFPLGSTQFRCGLTVTRWALRGEFVRKQHLNLSSGSLRRIHSVFAGEKIAEAASAHNSLVCRVWGWRLRGNELGCTVARSGAPLAEDRNAGNPG